MKLTIYSKTGKVLKIYSAWSIDETNNPHQNGGSKAISGECFRLDNGSGDGKYKVVYISDGQEYILEESVKE